MTKEKITITITTFLAFVSISAAGYVFLDTQKKDVQIKSLEGKEQESVSALRKAQESQAINEKTISDLKTDLEKMSAEIASSDEKIKSFSLQAAACESLKASAKKR